MERWALAIDLGTGGAKVGLVSSEGRTLGGAFEATALHLLPGGGAEQDSDDWFRAVTAAATRVTSEYPDIATRVPITTSFIGRTSLRWGCCRSLPQAPDWVYQSVPDVRRARHRGGVLLGHDRARPRGSVGPAQVIVARSG